MQNLIYLQAEKHFHGQDVSRFCDNQTSVTNLKKNILKANKYNTTKSGFVTSRSSFIGYILILSSH